MDFGEILGKAWKTIWKNKILWIFGILAGCGANSGGGSGGGNVHIPSNEGFQPGYGEQPFVSMFPGAQQFVYEIERFFNNIPDETWFGVLALLIVLGVLMIVITLTLGTIGRSGLIYGAWQADQSEATLNFGTIWRNGVKPYFWRVLGLTLLMALASILLALVITVPIVLISLATLGIGLFCLLPIICLMVPVFIIVNVIIEQATIAMVGEDLTIFPAIERAWNVVIKENLGSYAIMALALIIGAAIVGFVIGLPALFIMLPMLFSLIAGGESVLSGGLVVSGILFLIYLPIAILLQGILQAYVTSAWTLTFRRATGREGGDMDVIEAETDPDEPISPEPLLEETE